MKKHSIYIIAVFIVALIALTSCGKGQAETTTEATDTSRLQIVTTIFPQFDFARQITSGKADVTMLLKPGAESHTYEPSPKDIKLIQNSDLFIYVGGENDVWVEDILASMGDVAPDTLRLVDCVPTVTELIVEGMEYDHDHDHDHDHEAEHDHDHEADHDHDHDHEHEHEGEIDEHVWTSPVNAIAIVNKIAQIVETKDPDNAEFFEANRKAYVEKLTDLDRQFRDVVSSSKRKTILFGDRFPFRYFADEYGLEYYAAFPGCSAQVEASAATVAFLTDKVKEDKLPVVFTIELSNGKIADAIGEATGAQSLTLNSCHNVTKDQMDSGETYLSLMQKNVETLRIALN